MSSSGSNLAHGSAVDGAVEREDGTALLEIGRWAIVSSVSREVNRETQEYEDVPYTYLGCITAIGSNYVEVSRPSDGRWSSRIHFNEVWERMTLLTEADAEQEIQGKVAHWQDDINRLMGEIKELTLRLGLKTSGALPDHTQQGNGTALATLSSQTNVESYKAALIKAEKETLPALFKEMKESHRNLAIWLKAATLPLLARAGDMKEYAEQINDRVFNISLYAGLCESAVKVMDGKPAGLDDKLHVMQRRCYMDEECLVNYKAGGMSFNNIKQFDDWLAEPENRDRILPMPRCLVAFRVRRFTAERVWDGTMAGAYINFNLGQLDKLTFLYVRNGEQLWRIQTEIEFDALLFPDKAVYDPSEPMMIKKRFASDKPECLVPKREYDDMVERQAAVKAKHAAWIAEHGENDESGFPHSPYRHDLHDAFNGPRRYEPFDSSSTLYDDAMKLVENEIKQYNRIAVIIQGLFDRSEVLHPHLPVQTWTPEGFARAISLVFDGTQVLHDGEAPDFENYRQRCNATIGEGSVVIGQYGYWLERERDKEMERRKNDYRLTSAERERELTYWRPHGNPGPSVVATIEKWKPRSRAASFSWKRERLSGDYWEREHNPIECSISVPADRLFNISAYRPGDFKQFYKDSRTRAQYLKWAPILLAAEDWWAARS